MKRMAMTPHPVRVRTYLRGPQVVVAHERRRARPVRGQWKNILSVNPRVYEWNPNDPDGNDSGDVSTSAFTVHVGSRPKYLYHYTRPENARAIVAHGFIAPGKEALGSNENENLAAKGGLTDSGEPFVSFSDNPNLKERMRQAIHGRYRNDPIAILRLTAEDYPEIRPVAYTPYFHRSTAYHPIEQVRNKETQHFVNEREWRTPERVYLKSGTFDVIQYDPRKKQRLRGQTQYPEP